MNVQLLSLRRLRADRRTAALISLRASNFSYQRFNERDAADRSVASVRFELRRRLRDGRRA
jgi:hypothetical protein